MASMTKKNLDTPDETGTPDKTMVEIVDLRGVKAARLTAKPGWRWSACIKRVVASRNPARHPGHQGRGSRRAAGSRS